MSLPAALCADYTEAAYGIRVYAVSYTHLDVYKRQDKRCAVFCEKAEIVTKSSYFDAQ